MGRRNSISSLANWNARAPGAPFRASLDGNAHWDLLSDRIMPTAAAASRISPGGRMLLAFDLAETRDLFVLSHLDQGAQKEQDGADRATPRQGMPAVHPVPTSLDALLEAFRHAVEARKAATDRVEAIFLADLTSLLDRKDYGKAWSLISNIPDGCFARIMCVEAAAKAAPDAARSAGAREAMAYTREQAVALMEWIEAHRRYEALDSALAPLARERLKELLDASDEAGADAFLADYPPSVTRAFLHDMRNYPQGRATPAPSH